MAPTFPDHIDPPTSVLFLGSGFTRNATSIRDQNVPDGNGLRNEFAQLLGVSPSDYDLKVLAEELASRPNNDLYQLLYDCFTIKELHLDQTEIIGNKWFRIYTTNYDDAVEFLHLKSFGEFFSYNYDDVKPKRIPFNSVVHLHGSIRQLTPDNVQDQLILTERSYVRQHFERSLWYVEFIRDLRFCSACFFVGYGLYDHHIASLLLQNPAVTGKTHFIRKEGTDDIYDNRVSPYGAIHSIGVSGFAAHCRTLPRPAPLAEPYILKSFQYLDPHKDKKSLTPATAVEVFNLLTFGTFNYSRSLSTQAGAKYVVARKEAVQKAISLLEKNHCLLVHSRLGNGKSIFLYLLSTKLAELGYRCLLYRGENPRLQQELSLVSKLPKIVILIDSYTQAQDAIAHLLEACPEAKFVVTVRTGIHDVRLHEIERELPKPLARMNLNSLTSQDLTEFIEMCQLAGIGSSDLDKIEKLRGELRDILIFLFRSPYIQKKVEETFAPIFKDAKTKRILSVVFLLNYIGEEGDSSFLRTVTGVDAFVEMSRVKEISGEIFRLEDDEIQIRSAIFSEYVIQHLLEARDLLDSVYEIVIFAAIRKKERMYRVIMARLIQFSVLQRLLRYDSEKLHRLQDLYEKLRYHDLVKEEPLFWLQYTILMIERDNLLPAEEFLETAYARAAMAPGFKTFQIDTQALRLLLLLEERETANPTVRRFDQIVEKLELFVSMLNDVSHRYYAIRVVGGIEPFVEARETALTVSEKNVLVFWFSKLAEALELLPLDVRVETASDQILAGLLRAKARLVKGS